MNRRPRVTKTEWMLLFLKLQILFLSAPGGACHTLQMAEEGQRAKAGRALGMFVVVWQTWSGNIQGPRDSCVSPGWPLASLLTPSRALMSVLLVSMGFSWGN